ncbi:hypothetical protein DY000_02007966 [Brassica cretica]|uniref:Uncharacterized protein n=1 Tax=Brassica cretica TaxID=69181 RepID=A0ABQ7BS56_BRACR|nr:hypothetical protein DY000_02007966 [Brassica cretica]
MAPNRLSSREFLRSFDLNSLMIKEHVIILVLKVFCEIEADQESNLRASGGLRTWFIGVVFDTVDESLGRLRPCGMIRACSKVHYRSESVKFHWLLDFSSLGIVLVDILEESNLATELLRFHGHMTRCFLGARSSFGSSSFCIRDRTRCHYWRTATCRSFMFHELVRGRFVSASLGFRELDSSRDFCVAFDCGAVEMLLRSRNVQIVKWKIWENLEILCGLIVLLFLIGPEQAIGFVGFECGDNSSSLEGERGVLVVVVAQLSEAFFIDLEQDISFIGLEQDIEFM